MKMLLIWISPKTVLDLLSLASFLFIFFNKFMKEGFYKLLISTVYWYNMEIYKV